MASLGKVVGRRLWDRRAASEVIGALLIMAVTMAVAIVYAAQWSSHSQMQAASIADVLRERAKAQRQLLTLSYHYYDGNGNLRAYIYNFGSEDSTVRLVVVGGATYAMPHPQVQMRDACTGSAIQDCKIRPRQLVELRVPAPQGQRDLLIVTAEGGTFSWRLS